MFPIRDTIPHQRAPVVTILLIAANLAVFGYELSLSPAGLERLILLNGVVPRRFLDPDWAAEMGFGGLDLWPFLTCMFLHGGWLHLITNLWTLWIFGDNVEDRLGPLRYLLFYVATGLSAGLLHLATNPLSPTPTIGASGAIAGVMGAYFVLFPRAQVITLVPILFYPLFIQIPAVMYLGFWFLMQLLSGATTVGSTELARVAWWAHVGGFLAGILLLFLLRRRRPLTPPPPTAAWGVLLLALVPLVAGCARRSAAWRAELQSEDPHTALVAAVALAQERPRLAGAAIRVLVRHVDDELSWDRAGARRALGSIECARPELLLEYLVLKSDDRPDVEAALLPVLERADEPTRRTALALVRKHSWEASDALLAALASQARSDPDWVRGLEAELESAPPDREQLEGFLAAARSAP